MVLKKESVEKTRHVKNNNKCEKYILRGQRSARYHDRNLSNKKKSYIFNLISFSTYLSKFRTSSVQKKLMTSVAKDRILIPHQTSDTTIISSQITGCIYSLLYPFSYLIIIIYFYSFTY